MKKERKPNLYEFADKDGNVVSIKKKAEATADCLENVQWNEHETSVDQNNPLWYEPPESREPTHLSTETNVKMHTISMIFV